MSRSNSELSVTPRRNWVRTPSSKYSKTALQSTKVTPIRKEKRKREEESTPTYYEVVENEFYRSFGYNGRKNRKEENEDHLSFLFRGATNNIGTSTVGMYGEIAQSSLKSVCKKLVEYGLDEKSVVLDLGSGRGVPNFVFASEAKTFSSIGIEKCPIAYLNSINNVCIYISKEIKKIRTDIEESPFRPQKDEETLSVSTNYSSTEMCDSSPASGNEDEEFNLEISTQLEQDEGEHEFNENSETPSRFLRPPKLPHELDFEDFQQGLKEFKSKIPRLPVAFVNEDIIAYDSFEGVTHFYSFDFAMERALINNMVYQFKNTSTAYVFASFMPDLITSFELTECFLAAKVPCRMYGSNEGKTCYVYVKNNWKSIKSSAEKKLSKIFNLTSGQRNGTLSEKLSEEHDVNRLRFDVNNYDEPYSTMDIIKLSKLPLYYQYMWYLRRLDSSYRPFITRSQTCFSSARESLSSERDFLIERIAHLSARNSQEFRRQLKTHISAHFKRASTFP